MSAETDNPSLWQHEAASEKPTTLILDPGEPEDGAKRHERYNRRIARLWDIDSEARPPRRRALLLCLSFGVPLGFEIYRARS